jgi:oxygen-independent coproporphyrinogen-3 oxidase
MRIDPALIEKYNRPGPRYTSYPSALSFHEDFNAGQLLDDMQLSDRPLSLYVHIPFCASQCWFCACNTLISRDSRRAGHYLNVLAAEIKLLKSYLSPERKVIQLHLGGGTPNFLSPEQIHFLAETLRRNFDFMPDAECSVELDPRTLTLAQIQAFQACGFNRASFGIQDSNSDVQSAINRIQPMSMNLQTRDWLRDSGFKSMNVDLIYGLPFQTPETLRQTLQDVIRLHPDRLAVFSYAHVPWVRPGQNNLLRRTQLPAPQEKIQLFLELMHGLIDAGYVYIGMDHFARPTDELCIAQTRGELYRNFQGYSTRAGADICGIGLSSISQTANGYYQNLRDVRIYEWAISTGRLPWDRGYVLSPEDRQRKEIIMRLMCDFKLDYATLSARLGVNFSEAYAKEIKALDLFVGDGLIEVTSTGLVVTQLGRLFIRNIAMCFDAYVTETANRHSKTI